MGEWLYDPICVQVVRIDSDVVYVHEETSTTTISCVNGNGAKRKCYEEYKTAKSFDSFFDRHPGIKLGRATTHTVWVESSKVTLKEQEYYLDDDKSSFATGSIGRTVTGGTETVLVFDYKNVPSL